MPTKKALENNKRIEVGAEFLVEAGSILASSLEYEKTLTTISKLIVPRLADWCAVYILDEQGALQAPSVAHADPKKVRWALDLRKKFPIDMNAPTGAPFVVCTGKAEFVPVIPKRTLNNPSHTAEQKKVIKELNPRSYICVPLKAHGRTLGAITLMMSDSGRLHSKADFIFAERLAQKVAMAVETAKLYRKLEDEVKQRRQAQKELEAIKHALEERVMERTLELQRQTTFAETLLKAQSDLGNGVAIVDGKTQKFLHVNEALCNIYGYTCEELFSLPSFLSIVHPDELADFKEQLKLRLAKGAAPDHFEMTILKKNGASVYVEVSVKNVEDDGSRLVAIIRDVTGRKQSESALRRQEAQLREAQHIAALGNWRWNIATSEVSWSDELCHIYGLEPGSRFTYETFLNYIAEEDRIFVQQSIETALRTQKPFKLDHRITRPDGQPRMLHMRGEVIIDKGAPVGIRGTSQDITERKNIEKNLLKWQHVFEHARWGLAVGGPDGKHIEFMNPALVEMFGYLTSELEGRPIEFLLSPKARKHHSSFVQKIREQGHLVWETTGRKKDGTDFPIQIDLTVAKRSGKPLYYIASVRDLTERKKIEDQLREAHDELEERVEKRTEELAAAMAEVDQERAKDEALLNSIGDAVVAVDKQGNVMFVNETAVQLFYVSEADAIGKPLAEVLPIMDVADRILQLRDRPTWTSLKSGKRASGNFYYALRKDGHKTPVSVVSAPIVLEGKVVGAIGIYRDITKEHEVDRAKSEFVALASHQLRTPLTITSWYAEKLIDKAPKNQSGEEKKYLNELYKANGRMIDLVNALLDVSKIELGTLAVEPVLTDFRAVADSVLQELTPAIESKNLNIERVYDAKLPSVKVDQKLLRIIFQNLLSNATRYIDLGGTVKVKLSKQGTDLLIVIQDNGYGVPAHQQKKLFTKLFRGDNAREKEVDGTGLGLYIVKSIIERVNGSIRFESKEGLGTTFWVTLPLSGMTKKVVLQKRGTA